MSKTKKQFSLFLTLLVSLCLSHTRTHTLVDIKIHILKCFFLYTEFIYSFSQTSFCNSRYIVQKRIDRRLFAEVCLVQHSVPRVVKPQNRTIAQACLCSPETGIIKRCTGGNAYPSLLNDITKYSQFPPPIKRVSQCIEATHWNNYQSLKEHIESLWEYNHQSYVFSSSVRAKTVLAIYLSFPSYGDPISKYPRILQTGGHGSFIYLTFPVSYNLQLFLASFSLPVSFLFPWYI